MQIVLVIGYLVGWLAFLYAVVPGVVQGPTGAWLYRACILQPRSWPVGLPFVAAAFAIAFLWPLVLVVWLVTGRRPPPVVTTQALMDRYGVAYEGEGPVLTLVPSGVAKRLVGRTPLPIEFASNDEFWVFFLGQTD